MQTLVLGVVDEGQIIFIKAVGLFLHFNYILLIDFKRISRNSDPFRLPRPLHVMRPRNWLNSDGI